MYSIEDMILGLFYSCPPDLPKTGWMSNLGGYVLPLAAVVIVTFVCARMKLWTSLKYKTRSLQGGIVNAPEVQIVRSEFKDLDLSLNHIRPKHGRCRSVPLLTATSAISTCRMQSPTIRRSRNERVFISPHLDHQRSFGPVQKKSKSEIKPTINNIARQKCVGAVTEDRALSRDKGYDVSGIKPEAAPNRREVSERRKLCSIEHSGKLSRNDRSDPKMSHASGLPFKTKLNDQLVNEESEEHVKLPCPDGVNLAHHELGAKRSIFSRSRSRLKRKHNVLENTETHPSVAISCNAAGSSIHRSSGHICLTRHHHSRYTKVVRDAQLYQACDKQQLWPLGASCGDFTSFVDEIKPWDTNSELCSFCKAAESFSESITKNLSPLHQVDRQLNECVGKEVQTENLQSRVSPQWVNQTPHIVNIHISPQLSPTTRRKKTLTRSDGKKHSGGSSGAPTVRAPNELKYPMLELGKEGQQENSISHHDWCLMTASKLSRNPKRSKPKKTAGSVKRGFAVGHSEAVKFPSISRSKLLAADGGTYFRAQSSVYNSFHESIHMVESLLSVTGEEPCSSVAVKRKMEDSCKDNDECKAQGSISSAKVRRLQTEDRIETRKNAHVKKMPPRSARSDVKGVAMMDGLGRKRISVASKIPKNIREKENARQEVTWPAPEAKNDGTTVTSGKHARQTTGSSNESFLSYEKFILGSKNPIGITQLLCKSGITTTYEKLGARNIQGPGLVRSRRSRSRSRTFPTLTSFLDHIEQEDEKRNKRVLEELISKEVDTENLSQDSSLQSDKRHMKKTEENCKSESNARKSAQQSDGFDRSSILITKTWSRTPLSANIERQKKQPRKEQVTGVIDHLRDNKVVSGKTRQLTRFQINTNSGFQKNKMTCASEKRPGMVAKPLNKLTKFGVRQWTKNALKNMKKDLDEKVDRCRGKNIPKINNCNPECFIKSLGRRNKTEAILKKGVQSPILAKSCIKDNGGVTKRVPLDNDEARAKSLESDRPESVRDVDSGGAQIEHSVRFTATPITEVNLASATSNLSGHDSLKWSCIEADHLHTSLDFGEMKSCHDNASAPTNEDVARPSPSMSKVQACPHKCSSQEILGSPEVSLVEQCQETMENGERHEYSNLNSPPIVKEKRVKRIERDKVCSVSPRRLIDNVNPETGDGLLEMNAQDSHTSVTTCKTSSRELLSLLEHAKSLTSRSSQKKLIGQEIAETCSKAAEREPTKKSRRERNSSPNLKKTLVYPKYLVHTVDQPVNNLMAQTHTKKSPKEKDRPAHSSPTAGKSALAKARVDANGQSERGNSSYTSRYRARDNRSLNLTWRGTVAFRKRLQHLIQKSRDAHSKMKQHTGMFRTAKAVKPNGIRTKIGADPVKKCKHVLLTSLASFKTRKSNQQMDVENYRSAVGPLTKAKLSKPLGQTVRFQARKTSIRAKSRPMTGNDGEVRNGDSYRLNPLSNEPNAGRTFAYKNSPEEKTLPIEGRTHLSGRSRFSTAQKKSSNVFCFSPHAEGRYGDQSQKNRKRDSGETWKHNPFFSQPQFPFNNVIYKGNKSRAPIYDGREKFSASQYNLEYDHLTSPSEDSTRLSASPFSRFFKERNIRKNSSKNNDLNSQWNISKSPPPAKMVKTQILPESDEKKQTGLCNFESICRTEVSSGSGHDDKGRSYLSHLHLDKSPLENKIAAGQSMAQAQDESNYEQLTGKMNANLRVVQQSFQQLLDKMALRGSHKFSNLKHQAKQINMYGGLENSIKASAEFPALRPTEYRFATSKSKQLATSPVAAEAATGKSCSAQQTKLDGSELPAQYQTSLSQNLPPSQPRLNSVREAAAKKLEAGEEIHTSHCGVITESAQKDCKTKSQFVALHSEINAVPAAFSQNDNERPGCSKNESDVRSDSDTDKMTRKSRFVCESNFFTTDVSPVPCSKAAGQSRLFRPGNNELDAAVHTSAQDKHAMETNQKGENKTLLGSRVQSRESSFNWAGKRGTVQESVVPCSLEKIRLDFTRHVGVYDSARQIETETQISAQNLEFKIMKTLDQVSTPSEKLLYSDHDDINQPDTIFTCRNQSDMLKRTSFPEKRNTSLSSHAIVSRFSPSKSPPAIDLTECRPVIMSTSGNSLTTDCHLNLVAEEFSRQDGRNNDDTTCEKEKNKASPCGDRDEDRRRHVTALDLGRSRSKKGGDSPPQDKLPVYTKIPQRCFSDSVSESVTLARDDDRSLRVTNNAQSELGNTQTSTKRTWTPLLSVQFVSGGANKKITYDDNKVNDSLVEARIELGKQARRGEREKIRTLIRIPESSAETAGKCHTFSTKNSSTHLGLRQVDTEHSRKTLISLMFKGASPQSSTTTSHPTVKQETVSQTQEENCYETTTSDIKAKSFTELNDSSGSQSCFNKTICSCSRDRSSLTDGRVLVDEPVASCQEENETTTTIAGHLSYTKQSDLFENVDVLLMSSGSECTNIGSSQTKKDNTQPISGDCTNIQVQQGLLDKSPNELVKSVLYRDNNIHSIFPGRTTDNTISVVTKTSDNPPWVPNSQSSVDAAMSRKETSTSHATLQNDGVDTQDSFTSGEWHLKTNTNGDPCPSDLQSAKPETSKQIRVNKARNMTKTENVKTCSILKPTLLEVKDTKNCLPSSSSMSDNRNSTELSAGVKKTSRERYRKRSQTASKRNVKFRSGADLRGRLCPDGVLHELKAKLELKRSDITNVSTNSKRQRGIKSDKKMEGVRRTQLINFFKFRHLERRNQKEKEVKTRNNRNTTKNEKTFEDKANDADHVLDGQKKALLTKTTIGMKCLHQTADRAEQDNQQIKASSQKDCSQPVDDLETILNSQLNESGKHKDVRRLFVGLDHQGTRKPRLVKRFKKQGSQLSNQFELHYQYVRENDGSFKMSSSNTSPMSTQSTNDTLGGIPTSKSRQRKPILSGRFTKLEDFLQKVETVNKVKYLPSVSRPYSKASTMTSVTHSSEEDEKLQIILETLKEQKIGRRIHEARLTQRETKGDKTIAQMENTAHAHRHSHENKSASSNGSKEHVLSSAHVHSKDQISAERTSAILGSQITFTTPPESKNTKDRTPLITNTLCNEDVLDSLQIHKSELKLAELAEKDIALKQNDAKDEGDEDQIVTAQEKKEKEREAENSCLCKSQPAEGGTFGGPSLDSNIKAVNTTASNETAAGEGVLGDVVTKQNNGNDDAATYEVVTDAIGDSVSSSSSSIVLSWIGSDVMDAGELCHTSASVQDLKKEMNASVGSDRSTSYLGHGQTAEQYGGAGNFIADRDVRNRHLSPPCGFSKVWEDEKNDFSNVTAGPDKAGSSPDIIVTHQGSEGENWAWCDLHRAPSNGQHREPPSVDLPKINSTDKNYNKTHDDSRHASLSLRIHRKQMCPLRMDFCCYADDSDSKLMWRRKSTNSTGCNSGTNICLEERQRFRGTSKASPYGYALEQQSYFDAILRDPIWNSTYSDTYNGRGLGGDYESMPDFFGHPQSAPLQCKHNNFERNNGFYSRSSTESHVGDWSFCYENDICDINTINKTHQIDTSIRPDYNAARGGDSHFNQYSTDTSTNELSSSVTAESTSVDGHIEIERGNIPCTTRRLLNREKKLNIPTLELPHLAIGDAQGTWRQPSRSNELMSSRSGGVGRFKGVVSLEEHLRAAACIEPRRRQAKQTKAASERVCGNVGVCLPIEQHFISRPDVCGDAATITGASSLSDNQAGVRSESSQTSLNWYKPHSLTSSASASGCNSQVVSSQPEDWAPTSGTQTQSRLLEDQTRQTRNFVNENMQTRVASSFAGICTNNADLAETRNAPQNRQSLINESFSHTSDLATLPATVGQINQVRASQRSQRMRPFSSGFASQATDNATNHKKPSLRPAALNGRNMELKINAPFISADLRTSGPATFSSEARGSKMTSPFSNRRAGSNQLTGFQATSSRVPSLRKSGTSQAVAISCHARLSSQNLRSGPRDNLHTIHEQNPSQHPKGTEGKIQQDSVAIKSRKQVSKIVEMFEKKKTAGIIKN